MSFTTTKDRIWIGYSHVASWLARQPAPVRRIGYGVFGLALWTAYILPGNMVRPTFAALARHAGAGAPRPLFAKFVRGICLGLDRAEQLRHGRTDEIEAMLRIPEEQRLVEMATSGGGILVFPHTHAAFPMGRGLARRFPVLALVRSTADDRRAVAAKEIYRSLGGEVLDVRRSNASTVARGVLSALRDSRLVMGAVDRIRKAPPADAPIDARNDTLRVMAFGQPVGVTGWPARFGFKAGVPIVPATILLTPDAITLCLGAPIQPTADLRETTQMWMSGLEELLRAHPQEWPFALDKHWSQVLRAAPPA